MLSTDLLAFYRHVSQQPLTVIDVETSGYKPSEGRVIEISILQATLAAGIQQQQTYLVNPQTLVPQKITEFTGITQAMVDQAARSADVWPQCLPWLSVGVLTAHNLAFDYGFVRSEFSYLGLEFDRPATEQLCTVILSRLLLPELPSRSLPNLVRHFEFEVGPSHRAEADTLACWLLAKRLLTEIQNEEDETLLDRFRQQWLPLGAVAEILRCSGKQARSRLTKAGIVPRLVGRHNTPMYQRRDVERIFLLAQESEQLSWV